MPFGQEELTRFRAALEHQRAATADAIAQLAVSLAEVRAARGDGTADDEHDPDGSTLSGEWSRVAGLETDFASSRAAIDRALARIDDGRYGECVRCGGQIGAPRLEARPAAELCIDCARERERR